MKHEYLELKGIWGHPLEALRQQVKLRHFSFFHQQGTRSSSPLEELKSQIYLGSDDFIIEMKNLIDLNQNLMDIPKSQYTPESCSLQEYEQVSENRNTCIKIAYDSGRFSMSEIGKHFGLHYSAMSLI